MPNFLGERELAGGWHSQRIQLEGSLRHSPISIGWIFRTSCPWLMAPRSVRQRYSQMLVRGVRARRIRRRLSARVLYRRLGPRVPKPLRRYGELHRQTSPLVATRLGTSPSQLAPFSPRFEGPTNPNCEFRPPVSRPTSATHFQYDRVRCRAHELVGAWTLSSAEPGRVRTQHGGGQRSGWCSPIGDPTASSDAIFNRHSRCQSGRQSNRTRGA